LIAHQLSPPIHAIAKTQIEASSKYVMQKSFYGETGGDSHFCGGRTPVHQIMHHFHMKYGELL